MHARSWMTIAAATAMLLTGMAHAAETAYPTRPVRIIVPYPPGGTTDPTARAFGTWFSDKFGTTMVIDNRPGAGSTLGHGIAAKATPDGYTLVLGTSGGLVVSAAFGTKLSYDPVRDFTPIGIGVYVPFLIVVHPSVPAKNVKELIDLAKAQPGKINFASPGTGTPNHLGIELLTSLSGAKFTHVPYKGAARPRWTCWPVAYRPSSAAPRHGSRTWPPAKRARLRSAIRSACRNCRTYRPLPKPIRDSTTPPGTDSSDRKASRLTS